MLLFNTAEISKELQEKLGEDVISLASLPAADRDAFIVQPLYQPQVFNFLFYEKKWRFDRLHDMVLLFEPGNIFHIYSMQFQLGSRYYSNRLDISVPFNLHNSKLHSVKQLYSNAAKLEKLMEDIHAVKFQYRSTVVQRMKEQVKSLLFFLPV